MYALKHYTKDAKKYEAWEAAHGPVPDNHCLIYLDRNPENKAVENLACVSNSVKRIMSEHGLFSTDPETTRAGIAIAEHRSAIIRLVEKEIEQNRELKSHMPQLPEKPKVTVECKKCLKIKCKHWHFSLKGKVPPVCKKYNIPITEITAILEGFWSKCTKEYKDWKKACEDWEKTNKKPGPVHKDTWLRRKYKNA